VLEHCPSKTIRQLLFAIRYRFGSAGASPSHDIADFNVQIATPNAQPARGVGACCQFPERSSKRSWQFNSHSGEG
jgi:hypothetical protein